MANFSRIYIPKRLVVKPRLFARVCDSYYPARDSRSGIADGLTAIIDLGVNDHSSANDWVFWA